MTWARCTSGSLPASWSTRGSREGARIVTFGNGVVARELIVDVDETSRRLVWSVVGGRMTHHNASLQVFEQGGAQSRVVWIADLLPSEVAPRSRA